MTINSTNGGSGVKTKPFNSRDCQDGSSQSQPSGTGSQANHVDLQAQRSGGEERWGCHVDLGLDEEPDGCVIDYGGHTDCIHATFPSGRLRRSKRTCEYWRRVAAREGTAAANNDPASPATKGTLKKGEGVE